MRNTRLIRQNAALMKTNKSCRPGVVHRGNGYASVPRPNRDRQLATAGDSVSEKVRMSDRSIRDITSAGKMLQAIPHRPQALQS